MNSFTVAHSVGIVGCHSYREIVNPESNVTKRES